jgi:hypothetical protein
MKIAALLLSFKKKMCHGIIIVPDKDTIERYVSVDARK